MVYITYKVRLDDLMLLLVLIRGKKKLPPKNYEYQVSEAPK